MDEAISDTGPLLHLHEAGSLRALSIFARLTVPPLVAQELADYDFDLAMLGQIGVDCVVEDVAEDSWRKVLQEPAAPG